jgi:8-oxo-dGTP diphosphatase
MKEKIRKFNIRVYGIATNKHNEVLLTDEFRLNMRMTKFPGGGLEFGEGTVDCLKRECREELNSEIAVVRHFYTTDYFQPTTLLDEPQQLISIYYLITIPNSEEIVTADRKFDFENVDGAQAFRWVKIEELKPEDLTFPIDRKVLELLKSKL